MAARRWVFTLNNYSDDEVIALRLALSDSVKVRYAVFGFESAGSTSTAHLQGYCCLGKPSRLGGVKKIVGLRAHCEVAKGNEQQNYDYCTKEGNFEEFGQRAAPGKRSDLEEFKEAVKSGVVDLKRLREEHSSVAARYPRFVLEYVNDHLPKPEVTSYPLRPWQADLNQRLLLAPDHREIIFVVDYEGNKGKSWFAQYYMSLHDNAFLLRPMKHADMAYALPATLRVLFLDCTRKQVEYLPYTLLEELKDGRVFSSKYESRVKTYGPMHVVVLMNQDPDYTALSEDRYHIINLSEPRLI